MKHTLDGVLQSLSVAKGVFNWNIWHMDVSLTTIVQFPWSSGYPHARTGEIEALLQATLWSLTYQGNCPIELYYDAVSVGHGGTGQWNFPKEDKHARVLRALIQYAEHFHDKGYNGYHVKAHTGVLGNEVANFLAQFARASQSNQGAVNIDLGQYVTGERMPIEWMWLQLVPYNKHEDAYPQIVPGKLVAAGPTVDDSPDSAFPNNLKESTTQETKIVYANFFVATYNVGSLHRPRGHATDDGLCPQEYLRKQAQAHGITCLMLQETRAKRTGMVVSDSHIRLIAAGDQGRGGTEIWLAKRSSTGRSLGLQQQDVLVLISEAELLCARVRWPYGNFLIISAHGPHSGSGADEISRWWSKLSDLVTKLHRSDQEWLVIGIDANTNFENDHEPYIMTT